jgi:hypothetical protein
MMVERTKELWHTWIPAWLPICSCILGGAFYVGQYTQGINDRLSSVEQQIKAIQDYMRNDHMKSLYRQPSPGVQYPQQDPQTSDLPPTYPK